MVTTRSQATPSRPSPTSNTKTASVSIATPKPSSPSPSTSPSRPPNPRAFSSNHIGAPPDLFPTPSAHASRIHKAKSHLLLLLLAVLPLCLYFVNPSLVSSIAKYLSNVEWGTAAVVGGIVGGVMTKVLYWTDAWTVDWYETVVDYWWLLIPAFGTVGWIFMVAQEGEMEMVRVD